MRSTVTPHAKVHAVNGVCVGLLLAFFVYWFVVRSHTTRLTMKRMSDGNGGELLILTSTMMGKKTYWQIDTGYAGPPVLSLTYLSFMQRHPNTRDEFRDILSKLFIEEDEETQLNAIDNLVARERCFPYTSGCTMRLMGISNTVEQQADMLMCGMLKFENVHGRHVSPKSKKQSARADVLVSNSLPYSVHILTCDYLFQVAPCVIRMKEQVLDCNATIRVEDGFSMFALNLVGGSPVVDIDVGGTVFSVTVDTGATGGVCLGNRALNQFECTQIAGSVRQIGVNTDEICSSIVTSNVKLAGLSFENVPVYINDHDVEATDGYVGMGFLRCVDILITTQAVGFRRSGMDPSGAFDYDPHPSPCKTHANIRCAFD